jgi:hypothetical protein
VTTVTASFKAQPSKPIAQASQTNYPEKPQWPCLVSLARSDINLPQNQPQAHPARTTPATVRAHSGTTRHMTQQFIGVQVSVVRNGQEETGEIVDYTRYDDWDHVQVTIELEEGYEYVTASKRVSWT